MSVYVGVGGSHPPTTITTKRKTKAKKRGGREVKLKLVVVEIKKNECIFVSACLFVYILSFSYLLAC